MADSTEIQETLSDVLNNMKNHVKQNGDDSHSVNGIPESTLENPPVPLNNSEVQFNMKGSMLTKKFFQSSTEKKLSKSALNVYIFLGFNCDVKTGKINRDITINEIGAACKISNRTVTRAFAELQAKGFVNRIGESVLKGNLLLKKL